MSLLRALFEQLMHAAQQSIAGLVAIALQLVLYLLQRRTGPHIRHHKHEVTGGLRVTFLIRNLDSVQYDDRLVVALGPRAAIEWVGVHAGPYCQDRPTEHTDELVIAFDQVPSDATFSIQVELRRDTTVWLRLAESSPLRPPGFDEVLEPLRGVRGFGHFFLRGVAGLLGFATVPLLGLLIDGDAPTWMDWPYLCAGILLALPVFVLVVQTGDKPIVTGYLGWSGASKDWRAPELDAAPAAPGATTAPIAI
jgi:hypothetical protein